MLSYDEQTERDRIASELDTVAAKVRNLDSGQPAADADELGQWLSGLTEDLDDLGHRAQQQQEYEDEERAAAQRDG